MTTTTAPPSAATIHDALARHMDQARPDYPHRPRTYLYASRKLDCDRQAYLEATDPEAAPRFSPDVKARLLRGVDRERDLIIQLQRAGQLADPPFSVAGEQETVEITGRDGETLIRGKIDGTIVFASGEKWPYEIKSFHPNLSERIERWEDLLDSPWTRHTAYQIAAYLFAKELPVGLLVLDRPGLPRLIEVHLDRCLGEVEAFIQQAERVKQAIANETPPPFHPDPSVCRRCPLFGSVCNPPMETEGAEVIVDEELIAAAEEYVSLQDAQKRAAKLEKAIKGRLRGHSGLTLIGNVVAEGKWRRGRKLELPPEMVEAHGKMKVELDALEKQHTKPVEQGSFVVSFRRIEGDGF